MRTLSAQFLVSHDYHMLYESLPAAYPHVDEVILAVDRQHLSWAGNPFDLPDTFFAWVQDFDERRKVRIFQEDFFQSHLTPHQCDTRERRMLAEWAGANRWHIQIDADEQFLDFPAFIADLRRIERSLWARHLPLQVAVLHLNIYKETPSGYLVVPNYPNRMQVAANMALHRDCRNLRERTIYTQHLLLHHTFARSAEELRFKLRNYGHSKEFDTEAFIERWDKLDDDNYHQFSNFHHLKPAAWPSLTRLSKESVRRKAFDEAFLRSVRWPSHTLRLKNLAQLLRFSFKRLLRPR